MSNKKFKTIFCVSTILFSFYFQSILAEQSKEITIEPSDRILNDIIVKNKSDDGVFIATYYKKTFLGFDCKKWGDTHNIGPKSKIEIKRPPKDLPWDRKLIISRDKSYLKPTLTESEYKLASRLSIGHSKGHKFYINLKQNIFQGFNFIKWHIIKPIWGFFQGIIDPLVDKIIKVVSKHKYVGTQATVRISNDLPKQEIDYLAKRKVRVRRNLEKLLGLKLNNEEVPNIAFCFSGGGYRAMIGTLGSLLGAREIGFLNSIEYMSSLSGSTWLLSTWTTLGMPLEQLKENLRKKVDKDFANIISLDMSELIEVLFRKRLFDQDRSLVDLYGALLADKLLKDAGIDSQKVPLSETIPLFKDGKWPFPIYTAIDVTACYEWFEFTPFEIGSSYLNAFVPSWAFGRKFEDGASKDFAPEQSLGFLMGIWGSAFAADFEQIVDELFNKMKSLSVFDIINFAVTQTCIGDVRISPAHAFNFTYDMYGSPMRNIKELTLVDAGIDFNLPFPPLLRPERDVDIIIACDYSAGIWTSSALKGAEEYAQTRGIKFPKIDYSTVAKDIISIFKDEDGPVVIYLPLIKNSEYSDDFNPQNAKFCNTFNFEYSSSEFELLSGLTKFNIVSNKDLILGTIKEVALAKGMRSKRR